MTLTKAIIKHELFSFFFILLGVGLASFGITAFIIPAGLIDGGVTGLSLLLSAVYEVSLPLLLISINFPFILFGFRHMKWVVIFKGIMAILALSLSLYVLHDVHFPQLTNDILLAAIFGGVFLGGGIGFAIRGGGILDGTEILAITLSKRLHITMGDLILIFNLFIFSFALLFISVELVMYSILTYVCASKAIDFIVHGVEEYVGITIISEHQEIIRTVLTQDLGLSLTILSGKRGLTDYQQDVLYCVVSRFQVGKIKSTLVQIDPKAFFVLQKVSDTSGGVLKKAMYFHKGTA